MKFTIGKIIGVLGGILTIVGTVLPWATISGSPGRLSVSSAPDPLLAAGWFILGSETVDEG